MTDPGELFRFWLQHEYHTRGFSVPKLAATLRVQSSTVGHWLRRRGTIDTSYWPRIAAFFGKDLPDQMLAEARILWARPENRRYYPLQSERRPLHAGSRISTVTAGRVAKATELTAEAVVDPTDGDTTRVQRRRAERQPVGHKRHGR